MDNSNQINAYRSDIIRNLVLNFGEVLHVGTIKEVAKQNDYDVHKSTVALKNLSAIAMSPVTVESSSRTVNISTNSTFSRIKNPQNYVSLSAIENSLDEIIKGYKILILLRGLPGSGKSFLARNILAASVGTANFADHVFSADDFFMKSGVYNYDRNKIEEAHYSAQRNVFQKMLRGYSPLIVDNTNTEMWEMQPYAQIAAQCGYKINILEANTRWSFDCTQLAKKNQHGVPKPKIRAMFDRYTKNITPEDLLSTYNLPMEHQNKPQMRSYPPITREKVYSPNMYSSLSSSSIHNHNSMNQDLKLPEREGGTLTESSSSRSEVSNLIEIFDGDANSNVSSVPRNSIPEVDFASWGVDEDVLRSWGVVTALINDQTEQLKTTSTTNLVQRAQTCDSSSNTYLADFHEKSKNCRIVNGRYREINPPGEKLRINRPGLLDKGCSTQDDIISDRNNDLKALVDLFPKIPPLYIRDMYDDCKGNFDLAMEIFLEDNKDYSDVSLMKLDIYENSSKVKLENPFNEDMKRTTLNECSGSPSPLTFHESSYVVSNEPCSSTSSTKYVPFPDLPLTSEGERRNQYSVDDNVIIDSDSDLEFDYSGQTETDCTKSDDDDFVEINLGNNLIEQLEREFDDPGHDYPKGFQPVVQVPKSFARQLYTFYVESVYQQMETQKAVLDKLVKEDEAFARKLFEEENGLTREPPTGLLETMNEQAAMKIHEQEIAQWKNCTPNDLASQLTIRKLVATFPTVDRNVLLEIYNANNGNYKETVEDLLGSVNASNLDSTHNNFMEPPINGTVLQELEDATEAYSMTKDEEPNRSFQSYREEASDYLKKRNELYQKAQEYYSRGQREVAQWYSQLAQNQTQYYEIANNKAATVLLEEHSQRLQNFDTLDLHFLFVKEAISALDVFIDRNINLLKGASKTSQNLLVITGRGNRSKNGLSRIKPAVISRLKSRNIQFVQLNPGLLKIKVNRSTIATSDL